MVLNVKIEVCDDEKPLLIVSGAQNEQQYFLEYKLPDQQKVIKSVWLKENAAKFRDLPEGLPMEITIDNLIPKTVYYRNKLFYESGQTNPWVPNELNGWLYTLSPLFSKEPKITPDDFDIDKLLIENRDPQSVMSCIANFAGASAAIGATIGFVGGLFAAKGVGGLAAGKAGAQAGGWLGTALGSSFGSTYCSVVEFGRHKSWWPYK